MKRKVLSAEYYWLLSHWRFILSVKDLLFDGTTFKMHMRLHRET
jgi:hypothetical protein